MPPKNSPKIIRQNFMPNCFYPQRFAVSIANIKTDSAQLAAKQKDVNKKQKEKLDAQNSNALDGFH